MTSVGYATLDIIPSMKGIEGKLSSGLASPMSATGKKAGATLGGHVKSSFGSAVKGIAVGLGGALVATKAVDFLKDSIAEAREAQKVGAQTEAVIKATGGAAHVSAKQVSDFAGALSAKTGIDDEVIQSGQNMLLTFKNVRNEVGKGNDIFNQSSKTLIDMATAMGTEPKQAAIQLGKALNDPVKGISALSRVGVTFTDQQKAQIEALVGSGKAMEAQKIILKELNSEFGGSAEAQATAADKLKVAWGNFEEQIGTALLPVLDDLANWLLNEGTPAAEKFVGWFRDEGVGKLREFGEGAAKTARELEPLAKSLLHAGQDALPLMGSGLRTAVPLLKTLADTFNSLPDGAQKLLLMAGGARYLSGRAGLGGLNSILPGVTTGISGLGGAAKASGDDAKTAGGKFAGLKSAVGSIAFWAGAAATIDTVGGAVGDLKLALGDGVPVQKDSISGVLKQMQDSGFAGFAESAGINVEKLARQLQQSGDKGAYVKQVMDDLTEATGGTNEGFAHLGGWKAGLDRLVTPLAAIGIDLRTGGDEAWKARQKLENLIDSLRTLRQEEFKRRLDAVQLAGLMTGNTELVAKYGRQLAHLPPAVATKILTPGAVESRRDVLSLAKQFHLQPKQVRTIMRILDLATPGIHKVDKGLDNTGRKKTVPKILADSRDADRKTGHVLDQLVKIGNTHATAKVNVNTGDALARLGTVDRAIASVAGTFFTTIVERTVHKKAQGGLLRGPGSGTSDSIPVLASNGEYWVRKAAVDKYGVGMLDQINQMRFKDGGQVGGYRNPPAPETNVRSATAPARATFSEEQFKRLEQAMERGAARGVAARTSAALAARRTS